MTAEELHQASIDVSWREEALWALITGDVLRPLAELSSMLDFYNRLHWHARNARYHGQVRDPDIAPGFVLERRRALEWLLEDVPREDVDLDA